MLDVTIFIFAIFLFRIFPHFLLDKTFQKKKKNAKHCSIEDILKGKEQQDSLSTNF